MVEVKVRSNRDVPENMLFMPFFCAEAVANLLNPALNPFVLAERAEIRSAGRTSAGLMR